MTRIFGVALTDMQTFDGEALVAAARAIANLSCVGTSVVQGIRVCCLVVKYTTNMSCVVTGALRTQLVSVTQSLVDLLLSTATPPPSADVLKEALWALTNLAAEGLWMFHCPCFYWPWF